MVEKVDLTKWSEAYFDGASTSGSKEAIVLILLTLSDLEELPFEALYLKGGICLALAHKSQRSTNDIDYSASGKLIEDIGALEEQLNKALSKNEIKCMSPVTCRVKRIHKKPKGIPDPTFPALRIDIGYALKKGSDQEKIRRQQQHQNIGIDISFNEYLGTTDELIFTDKNVSALILSVPSIIAEKFRAIFQTHQHFLAQNQDRKRGQDIPDLYTLFSQGKGQTDQDKAIVLKLLKEKSKNKGIDDFLNKDALRDVEVKERARRGYEDMRVQIKPDQYVDFEILYENILQYFESLPWGT